jgi:hypothetical protein
MGHAEGQPAAELEREVTEDRERIDNTLREIQSRLTPGQLVDEMLRHGRGAGQDLVSNLGRTLSANPLPTALVGVGLLWLILAPRSSAPPRDADVAEVATAKATPP